MKVVIVGDGKVGGTIARQLSGEGHDIIVIDNNTSVLNNASNTMDIMSVEGNGASMLVQKRAGVPEADLLIAATSADEVNMLACLLGKKLGVPHTIARVRNPEYYEQINELKEELGLSMTVNPEFAAATEILRLLRFPSALKIEVFARGRVELVEVKIPPHSVLDGMPLWAIYKEFQVKVLICAVQRAGEVHIPNGNFVLQAGDKINLTASHSEIEKFFRTIGLFRTGVKSVMILGGGRMAYYLAKALILSHVRVKIIELDYKRCEYLCEALPEAVVIHGDGTDKETLQEEGLEKTDALVCLTGMDEENIILSLYAKSQNVDKIVAKVNEDRRARMVEEFGIDSIVSVKTATADAIMSYVRARKNSQASANIETMYQLVDDKVEALEFIIKSATEYTGIPLKDLALKPNNLIVCIGRKRQIILPIHLLQLN